MRLFDVWPNFVWPQVQRSVIISNKDVIHELLHELLNNLRLLRIFATWKNIRKISKISSHYSLLLRMKISSILEKKSWKIEIELFSYRLNFSHNFSHIAKIKFSLFHIKSTGEHQCRKPVQIKFWSNFIKIAFL